MIHYFLEQHADKYANKVALVHEESRSTYSQINHLANHLARFLVDSGIKRSDRVAILLENSLEYIVSYYGILKTGAVVSPLGIDLKPSGLKEILNNLLPKVIISSSRFERLLKATDLSISNVESIIIKEPKQRWDTIEIEITPWADAIKNNQSQNLGIDMDKNQLASIIYTSGSMGKSKGVMLSHDNIISNTNSIVDYLELTEKDIQMIVLPFFYVMGKSLLNSHFSVGGTVIINNKFAYPATIIKQMAKEKVTGFSGVPSTYAYLLNRSPLYDYREQLPSLRYCSQAGGHMSIEAKKDLLKILPKHTKLYVMYGATEASARLTYLTPDWIEKKMGSIGKPILGVSIRIAKENGTDAAAGETGQLVASGDNIMQGYWKDQAATANVLINNAYYTGDMGYIDEDGFLFITGRKDNLIKTGGHRVNPQEIEDVIMTTGIILETVVFGVSDHLLGNRLAALVVSKNQEQNKDIILKQCSKKLPKFKIPGKILFVHSLPKKISGKIDREKCNDLINS